MPVDLPGFYFDESRNRYFPLSSKPKEIRIPQDNEQSWVEHRGPKRQYNPWRTSQIRMASSTYSKISRELHHNLCFHYAHTSLRKHELVPTLGHICAIHCTKVGNRFWRLVGDDQGWLHSNRECSTSIGEDAVNYWSADWNLRPSCPISSISVSGNRSLSTCLGPGKFSMQDLSAPERMFLLNLNGVADIRASHLQGNEVVLGAKQEIVHILDIDRSTSPRHIRTKSDVFTILQRNQLVYAGERNGSIELYDMRMASHKVLHLDILRLHELLVSHLNGNLLLFDLRFSRTTSESSPLQTFEGHVNDYHSNLGIAVDPEQDFLFAAGQDCRIRAWSLRTGLALIPGNLPDSSTNPFSIIFPSPVSALQVTKDSRQEGISLWAAYEHDLCRFHLGERNYS